MSLAHRQLDLLARHRRTALALVTLGATGLALGIAFAPDALAVHLLLWGFTGVCLGLAGAVFIALQYLTGAAWSVVLRRIPEAMTCPPC